MADRTVILLRCHYYNRELASLWRTLRDQFDLPVYLAVDESGGTIDTYEKPKVAFSAEQFREQGLFCPKNRALWQCGDYAIYEARRLLPGVEHFLVVDHDVRFLLPRDHAFWSVAKSAPQDLLCCNFRRADRSWGWYRAMASWSADVYRIFFPVLRISARLIDALLERRLEASSWFERQGINVANDYPNDEAFVATEAKALGFTVMDFNQAAPGSYSESTFAFDDLFHVNDLQDFEPNSGFVHPVLSGDAFIQKLARLRSTKPADWFDQKVDYVRNDEELIRRLAAMAR